jgi:type II secretory pathway pseudopilin PulG
MMPFSRDASRSKSWNASGRWGKRRKGRTAFSLLELLVATAVFVVLVLVLAMISHQAVGTWSRNENKSELRESARTAINFMRSELRQAVLPIYRDDQAGLQFVVNPPGISAACKNRDLIFWQAPIATSRTKGDLAIVGYFVRKQGNVFKLCRLFVNPDDPAYQIYSKPNDWVNDALLDSRAPATEESDLQGVFLENVPGMWVSTFDADGAPTDDGDPDTPDEVSTFDSRKAKKLPARVEISLALLDKLGADRVARGQITLPEARDCANVAAFLEQLPDAIKANVQTVTINVPFLF